MRIDSVLLGVMIAVATLTAAVPGARAAACKDEKVIEDLWEEYDRNARAMGCAAPVKGPFQYTACVAAAAGKIPVKITDRMIGYWNSMAQGGWATIGPRMLGPTPEKGTLVGTSGRTFVTVAPANTGKATVTVAKTDGRVGTEVTVCATRRGEKPRVIWNFKIDGGKQIPKKPFEKVFTNVSDSFISIHLDGKSLNPLDKFAYEVAMEAEPVRWDFGPVKGWVDLHLHQAAELGQAGTMYYGSHTGPLEEALKSCSFRQHGLPFNVGKWDQYRHGDGYPTYTNWPHHLDIGHQQAHAVWLEAAFKAGLKLVVVSAVNNEPGCKIFSVLHTRPGASCRDMPNLNAQIDAFIKFDEEHDWYEIAVDPWHARKIINDGKMAVVISLESSNVFPSDAGDFVEQLQQVYVKGVRTLQPTHEVDSEFSGAAPWSGMFELLQTVKYPVDFDPNFLKTLTSLKPGFDYETVTRDGKAGKYNRVGLKPKGYKLIDEMVARHMPIDVAHMSVKATEEVYAHLMQKHGGYPMYVSHTRFNGLLVEADFEKQQELSTNEGQIDMVKKLGGMVGLRTGPQPIKPSPSARDDAVLESKTECHGTSRSYVNLLAYGRKRGVTVALGTDMNGNTGHLGSRFKGSETGCPGGGTPEDAARPKGVGAEFADYGLRHVGLIGDMIADVRALDPESAEALDRSAEAYLKMWERAWVLGGGPESGPAPTTSNSAKPACVNDFECGEGKWCNEGVDLKFNTCELLKNDNEACAVVGGAHQCKGKHCSWGRCYTPESVIMGGTCYVDDACKVGRCSAVDGTRGTCVCKEDSDCGSGKWCNGGADFTKNTCEALKNDNDTCDLVGGGHQCKSGQCRFSRCYTPGSVAMGGTCYTDDACKAGKCSAIDGAKGTCVCQDDGDCGAGKWCDAGFDTKVNVCRAKLNKGQSCGKAGSVGNDHKCKSGECSGFPKYECK